MEKSGKKGNSQKKIAQPRPQTLSTPREPTRRLMPVPNFTLKLGDRMGEDLTIIGHLSRGRISELYQVWSIFYTCALTCKILSLNAASDPKSIRNFRREAMLLRRLEHPQIVRIFKQGTFEGRDYLVQEYLHGPSLFELIDLAPKHQLPVPDAIKAIIHICSALDHLHAKGYIYRDMKPSNIILRGGIPVLVDFDAAIPYQPGRKSAWRLGTDPYMAPEQCVKGELSKATDIYGLGAVLYEMLTGRWPYEQEILKQVKERSLEERYPQIRGEEPENPKQFNPEVSDKLSAVLLRCLENDPRKRFQSVRELIRALVPLLQGKDRMWPESVDLGSRVA
jgi:serine/threonine-protein kinase